MTWVIAVALLAGFVSGALQIIGWPDGRRFVQGSVLRSGHDSTALLLAALMYKRVERRQHPNGERTLMSLEFKTAKKRRDPIPFTIDGDSYTFTPPQTGRIAVAMMSGDENEMIKETFDWLSNGLPEEQTKRLMDRLRDPDDEFDMEDLTQLVQGLQQEVTGRPTS